LATSLTPAERQRRHRDRLQRGVVLAQVEIGPALLDEFMIRGWITEVEIKDPVALGKVIQAIIEGREPRNLCHAVTRVAS